MRISQREPGVDAEARGRGGRTGYVGAHWSESVKNKMSGGQVVSGEGRGRVTEYSKKSV